MKIIQAQGQTCNQFWIYSHYLAEAIERNQSIIILAPEIGFKNYPNIKNHKLIKLPFYRKLFFGIIPHDRYIIFIDNLFNNSITKKFLSHFSKLIPKVSYKEAQMGRFTKSDIALYKKELKKIFQPKMEVIDPVTVYIEEKKKIFDFVIGIHIRRGDYRTWQDGKFFYTDNQYNSLMNRIEELFPKSKVGFFLSSNEKINLSALGQHRSFLLEESSAAHDLYSLSLCDYVLGPPSSYSSWASFYGDVPLYFIKNIEDPISLEDFNYGPLLWPPFGEPA